MRITVLGGCGGYPVADQGCGGYLLEQDGFRLLIDPGYGTVRPLMRLAEPTAIDAVLVSHGHPDHCADLHPLLRARRLTGGPGGPRPPVLPLFAPAGALDHVLGLDGLGELDGTYRIEDLTERGNVQIGPFTVDTRMLPHHLPNAGTRIAAGGGILAYTGDSGASPVIAELAAQADVLLAEATYAETLPPPSQGLLSTAVQAGGDAHRAGAGRLLLTHLWPGSEPTDHLRAAADGFAGPIDVARPGLVVEVG
jgi:ribonuclease BN (tRNA processing enzyme)